MSSRGYGATAARLTPDQKVGGSNLSALILHLMLTTRGNPGADSTSLADFHFSAQTFNLPCISAGSGPSASTGLVANLRSPSSRQIRLEGRQVRLACRPKTLACRLLHEPQSNKTPCGLVDKALVFETKDCRLESCQGHALGRACIATPDHAGLLESARRRFCHAVKHCKACSPCE